MGKRGKQAEKGFSLKQTNKGGNVYVYVWDEYNNDKKKEAIESRGTKKNSSRYDNYTSIGAWGNPETFEKLKLHLSTKYGENFADSVFEKYAEEIEREVNKKKELELFKEYMIKGIMDKREVDEKKAETMFKQAIKKKIEDEKGNGRSAADAKYIVEKWMLRNYYELKNKGVL